jgi:hypothetical protein
MARKPTETVKLNLRLPERLRKQLERDAKRNGLSLNAEMIYRLESAYSKDQRELLIEALVGGGRNANFLRGIAVKMQQHQYRGWDATKEGRARFARDLAAELLTLEKLFLEGPDDQEAAIDWMSSKE